MYCEVILTIHALTQWNVDKRVQGHTDTPLNKVGIQMAQNLAERLKDEKIDAIYSSDLRRAYETAAPLSKIKEIPIITDVRLREGRWKNQEWKSEYPVLPYDMEHETREEVRKRVVKALNEIVSKNPGKRILIVSHGGIVKEFIKHLRENSATTLPEYKSIRTALNCFKFENGKWTCMCLNDDRHIKEVDLTLITKDAG